MLRKTVLLCTAFLVLSLVFYLSPARSAKVTPPKAPSPKIEKLAGPKAEEECYQCHEGIKGLKVGNKHASVACTVCHGKVSEHLANPEVLPETNLELSLCGRCHPFQFQSLMAPNLKSKAKVEKANTTSRSPMSDLLLMPHGFTKEHDEPRSHAFMVIDHLLVDRAFGGRFQLKTWKDISKPAKVWDGVVDTGKELPQTAKAANSVCPCAKPRTPL